MRKLALLLALSAPVAVTAQEPPKPVVPEEDSWDRIDRSTAEVGAYIALQMIENAYGGRNGAFTFGLTGGYIVAPWLELQGSLDFASQKEDPADLTVKNTTTFAGVGPVVGVWLEFVHFFVELAGGTVLRTLNYSDAANVAGSAARVSLAWQGGGGMGVVIGGRFGFALRGLGRFHDDRANILLTMDFTWFFGPK